MPSFITAVPLAWPGAGVGKGARSSRCVCAGVVLTVQRTTYCTLLFKARQASRGCWMVRAIWILRDLVSVFLPECPVPIRWSALVRPMIQQLLAFITLSLVSARRYPDSTAGEDICHWHCLYLDAKQIHPLKYFVANAVGERERNQ
jgi:hypothetical protein